MNINNLLSGIEIIRKYINSYSSPAIGDKDSLIFAYLDPISNEDLEKLKALGWSERNNIKSSYAECKLYYAD